DFAGVPSQNLFSGSVVFSPPHHPVRLDDPSSWWSYVEGANWKHPEGSNSTITDRQKHPVVQVGYNDAVAYCSWERKRLPTEAQFEYAARGGLDRKPYAWGDAFLPNGRHMANTFQGHF